MLAGGGVIGLLDGVAEVARGAGLDEAGALAIYVPLIRQALANAEAMGIGDALTGPFVRGDVGTVRGHLQALRGWLRALSRCTAPRPRASWTWPLGRGDLDEEQAAPLRRLLAGPIGGTIAHMQRGVGSIRVTHRGTRFVSPAGSGARATSAVAWPLAHHARACPRAVRAAVVA